MKRADRAHTTVVIIHKVPTHVKAYLKEACSALPPGVYHTRTQVQTVSSCNLHLQPGSAADFW